MPLIPPYRETVKPSDLAYGLAGPRARYLDECAAFSGGVDLVNNYRISAYEQRQKPDVPVREPEFLRAVEQHPKYSSILGQEYDTNELIRRKCKAGLHWGTHDSKGTHIHFVLDSLNQDPVVEKNHGDDYYQPHPQGVLKERAITNAELRWLYRNRDDPDVRDRVQFWEDFKPVAPPWVANALTWAKYRPGEKLLPEPEEPEAPAAFEAFPDLDSPVECEAPEPLSSPTAKALSAPSASNGGGAFVSLLDSDEEEDGDQFVSLLDSDEEEKHSDQCVSLLDSDEED